MTAPRERNRWAIVATYALVASANQMLWLTFAPITTASAHYYGVSEGTIGWLSEIFPLIYVILAVPAAAALDRWFRPALAGGAALTAIGALVRLGGPTFAWAMAGQLLIAVAQPLVLNAVTGVASGYLTVASRPLGISLGSAGVFLGILISLVLGAALGGSRLHALLVIGAVYGVLAAVSLLATLAPARTAGRPGEHDRARRAPRGVARQAASAASPPWRSSASVSSSRSPPGCSRCCIRRASPRARQDGCLSAWCWPASPAPRSCPRR